MLANNIDIHDKVTEAYYGLLGPNFMKDTQQRIHWIGRNVDGNNILDIGCSQGIVSILLAREGKKVLGIDINKKSIHEAEKYLQKEEKSTQELVKFQTTDYINTDFEEQFDTIILTEVLEHLMNPEPFIKKAKEDLIDNGKLIITVPFGINDFIDHKQTYYYIELFEILKKYFLVKETNIIEKWIGYICINMETNKQTFQSHDIYALEKGFYNIERKSIEKIKDYINQVQKLKIDVKQFKETNTQYLKEKTDLKENLSELKESDKNNKQKIEELKILKVELENKLLQTSTNFKEMNNRNQKLLQEIETLNINKRKLQNKLDKALVNFNGMDNRNKTLSKRLDKITTNFEGMDHRNKRLQQQIIQLEKQIEKTKNTLSYRWGHSLVLSTKSFATFIKLPFTFYKEYRAFKKQTNHYAKLKFIHQENNNKKNSLFKKNIDFSTTLKMASIMDEFTYNSFKYECNLLQVTPENWKKELEYFKPEIFFIESAWKGKDDKWATKISNCSNELQELVSWCHKENIPVIFWNKEDPVHFDTFLDVAKIVDVVFTTDLDCIAKYKKNVGHENVFFLPFAAQPKVHNPIEKYDRRDAFNFAGSYYLRYPQRQRDFASLIDAVQYYKPIDIYDRNYDNPHPHYTFPDKYKPYILGKLPFTEIDKAYKGYKFGINMNTIKQSQTMFARRVYELLASNTVVASNFSRGVRLLFGDLVISSDDKEQIKKMLEPICEDELYYRKFRLLGLRKVMAEHTYKDRLAYIISKINGKDYRKDETQVILSATISSMKEYETIKKYFDKQSYIKKQLYILDTNSILSDITDKDVFVCNSITNLTLKLEEISKNAENTLYGKLNPDHYYGKSYLKDLVLASVYAKEYKGYVKYCHYVVENNDITLKNDTAQYKPTSKIDLNAGLVYIKYFNDENIDNLLALDEFNFCKNGASYDEDKLKEIVDDLIVNDYGISFEEKLAKLSEKLPAKIKEQKDDSSLPQLSAKELFGYFKSPSSKVKLTLSGDRFEINTKLGRSKHSYLYTKPFTREELNLVLNSQFKLESSSSLEEAWSVFEFQDKDGKKISHSMNRVNEHHALAIPNECVYIRFGLKIVGDGKLTIHKLILGTQVATPFAVVAKSKKLVLTKQYPSYDDIYKYGFLHSRIRAYKESGMIVDIFRINNQAQTPFREFEDIDVATGDAELLEETLKTGQYDHVLVHLIDQHMWKILEKFIDKIKVTVWVHGAEIQVWQRRKYEFERMTSKEIDRQKRLSNQRKSFWRGILSKNHSNFKYIFVSDYFKNESLDDLGIKMYEEDYSIIHNYIDSNLFTYREKSMDHRKKILSIRPYASRKYANDLSIQAVIALSKKDFFNDLEFCFVGDGVLFDELIAPLRKFSNVKIVKSFLTHNEIVKYHQEYGIFLTPTRMDSQGVSRDEAMSSGLVPITTNVAAIPEFVDDSCGMVVEPENPQALADAIEYLYKNPQKFLELSEAAAKRVRKQCSFENTIGKEIEIIEGKKK